MDDNQTIFNNKKLVTLVMYMLLVLIVGVGVTYAYFGFDLSSSSTKVIGLEGADIEISYNSSSIEIIGANIEPGWVSDTKDFSVTLTRNNSKYDIYYLIGLHIIENTFPTGALRYDLVSDDGGLNVSNGELINGLETEYSFGKVKISLNETHNYSLTVYYPETGLDQNNEMGSTFKAYATVLRDENIFDNKVIKIKDNTGLISKTKDNITIGDMVTIGTENFYVIETNSEYISAIAEWNLLVGNICKNNADYSCTLIENTKSGYGMQSSDAIGYINDDRDSVGTIEFSNNNCTYLESQIEKYVNDYVNALNNKYKLNLKGSLLSKSNLESLKEYYTKETSISINHNEILKDWVIAKNYSAPFWIYQTTYWINEFDNESAYMIYSNYLDTGGSIYTTSLCNNNHTNGVRPVINIMMGELD